MDIIWFLLIGLCAGWLAGQVTKGHAFGLVGNLVVGVVGALIGGFLFRLIGVSAVSLLGQLLMAVVGAIVLLAILGQIQKTRR